VLPGINPSKLDQLQSQTAGGLMSLLDMFSGGAFSNASIFALGIMPYISASIVMQLLAVAVPYFQKMQREGESGRKKINWYTRILTVGILLLQAPSYLLNLKAQAESALSSGISWTLFMIPATILLAAGSMFILWLGERITDKGVGNGISMIIMIGIIARLPQAFVQELGSRFTAISSGGLVMFIIEILVLYAVVCASIMLVQGTRKIPVQYAKRLVGNKQYGGARQYIPLKLFAANVMPIIFASSILQTPIIICRFLGIQPKSGAGATLGEKILKVLNQGAWCNFSSLGEAKYTLGLVFYVIMIIFFAYFYTSITFNPLEIANNMKKSGGFIPGIRPGRPTSDYLTKVLNSIIFIGACGLTVAALIPIICAGVFGADVSFGGTSLIIVVGVILETMKQIESMMLERHYKGFLND